MVEKVEINGIKDSDVESFLIQFNSLQNFKAGKITCKWCKKIITMENLGGFLIKDKNLIIFCNSSECIDLGIKENEH